MNIISLHSVPRSGSTWLLSLFEAHSNIKTIYQPLFSYAFKNKINKNSNKEDFDNFINELIKTDDGFCCMTNEYHNNGKTIIKEKKKKINYLLMKNVHHHNLMEKFIELCPDIKILCLIREPKSTIFSQMTAKKELLNDWLNGEDKNQGKEENFFGFNKWLEFNELSLKLKDKYPNNIVICKYEKLINNIEKIKEVFDLCNITWDNNIEKKFKEFKLKNETYDYSVYKKEDTVNKWRGKLDKNIIDYINERNRIKF